MFVSDHDHARLLLQIYGDGPAADAAWDAAVAESFVCHAPGDSPITGEFVGPEAMRAHVEDLYRRCDGTFDVRLTACYADDAWGLTPQVVSVSRQGRSIVMPATGCWRFSALGRIAEHWELVSDQAAWDAFWRA